MEKDIFFYTCINGKCDGYQMLHQSKCCFCNAENPYFEGKGSVSIEDEQELTVALRAFTQPQPKINNMNESDITNPNEDTMASINENTESKIDESINGADEEATEILPKKKEIQIKEPEAVVETLWKCWKCQ
jgi:hypothetical protein